MAAKNIKWDITSKCNLRCAHCSVAKSYFNSDIKELSLDERLTVLDRLIQSGVEGISLLGGEPLTMNEDLFKLLEKAKSGGLKVSLVTNGTLLTEQRLARLVDLSIDHIVVSIEGACRETHELVRGRHTFDKTTSNVRALTKAVREKQRATRICVNTVLNRINFSEIDKMVDLCVDLGVHEWTLLSLVDIGNAELNKDTLPVTPLQEIEAARQIAEFHHSGRTGDLLISPQFVYPLIWDYVERKYGLVMPRQMVCCNASTRLGFITPDGTMYPCDRVFTENLVGKWVGDAVIRPMSLAERPFYEIWNSDYYLNFFDFILKDETYRDYEPCNHCKYFKNRFCNPCPLYALDTKVVIRSCLIAEQELGDISGEGEGHGLNERLFARISDRESGIDGTVYFKISKLVPKKQSGIRSSRRGDYLILFNPYNNEFVTLNLVGCAIWEAIDGKNSVEQINAQMFDVALDLQKYLSADGLGQGLQNLISRRLSNFLVGLEDSGLLTWA